MIAYYYHIHVFLSLSIFITTHHRSAFLKAILVVQTFCLFIQLRTAAFKAYCAIWVRRSNFRHQASPRVSLRESTQRRKVELWARNVL